MDSNSAAVQPTIEALLSYAALGLIVGFVYYLAMRLDGGLPGEAPRLLVLAVHGFRLVAAIAFFVWLAYLGAVPVLSAFAGFLVGRVVAFRTLGEDA